MKKIKQTIEYIIYLLLIAQVVYSKVLKQIPISNPCGPSYIQTADGCQHQGFFAEFGVMAVLGLITTFFLAMLACFAGVGGGEFNVPIALVFFSMSIKDAVPYSIFVVFSFMVFRFTYQFVNKERHPYRDKPIINYELAAIFSPSIFIGTQIGVLASQMLTELTIFTLFLIVMTLNLIATFFKFLKFRTREMQDAKHPESQQNHQIQIQRQVTAELKKVIRRRSNENVSSMAYAIFQDEDHKDKFKKEKLQFYEKKEAQIIHWESIYWIVGAFFALMMVQVFRGTKKFESIIGLKQCESLWWVLSFIYIPIALLIVYFLSKSYANEHQEKQYIGYQFYEDDLEYSVKNIISIVCIGFLVGLLASLLGLGGAILISPIMLILKQEPTVGSYTSSFVALLTGFANSVQYFVLGRIQFSFAIFAMIFGIGGFAVGLHFVTKVQKKNKQSYIVAGLAFVLILAISLMIYKQSGRLDFSNGINFVTYNLCK